MAHELGRFNPLAGRSFREAAADLEASEPGALIGEDGSIQLGKVTLLPNGLQVRERLTEDEWLLVGGVVQKLQTSVQWLIGDWMAYGEREYGKTYEEIAALFGYEINTLYVFTWVCKRVKIFLRGKKLSIGHAKLLAGFEPAKLAEWINYLNGLEKWPTVRELDALIKGVELPAPRKGVERVVYAATTVQAQVAKLMRKPDGATRQELRALADAQIRYWQGVQESLDQGG